MFCVVYSTVLRLPGLAEDPQAWHFDLVSALIGAVVALLLVGLAYRSRDALRMGWETVTAPISRLSRSLQATVEDRYRELVVARAQSLIVPRGVASLGAVFIEPKLLSSSLPPQSISEIDVLSGGPRVLSLRRILRGHPQLAIVGAAGTGKTTLLAYIALVCAQATGEKGAERGVAALGLAQGRLPLLLRLSAMDWDEADAEEKEEDDSLERLVGAALVAVGGNRGMEKTLRQHLGAGRAIVLADGWGELLPQQRKQAAEWLSGLVEALPGNLWLVGASARGYAPLIGAGFVPLALATWDIGQAEMFANKWVEACRPADESLPIVPRQLVVELQRATQAGSSPLELALRAFVRLSGEQAPAGRALLFNRAFDLLLQRGDEGKGLQDAEFDLLEACQEALGRLGLAFQQEGRTAAGQEEIQAAVESTLVLARERPGRAIADVLKVLTGEHGVFHLVDPDRYAFSHPIWQAYFTARELTEIDSADPLEWLEDPRWAEVLRFYAELGDMGPLVTAWVRGPDDLFRSRLRTLGSWIGVAPSEAAWRDGAMAVLARGFLQPGQPAQIRQGLAEALAMTGMPGTTYLFKQALRHADTGVRVAAVLGLIRTAGESDLALLEAMLEDEEVEVRQAAVRGLAHINPDVAVRWLGRILLVGDEALAPVAAEVLAQYGEEGEALLREAMESDDMMARRAAVFGLVEVGARDPLERAAREDNQWIVRSAASAALEELDSREKGGGVAPAVEIEQIPWLISWAASQGEGVGLGEAAREMLLRAFSEGDAAVRLAAALTLAQEGRPGDVELLRAALADPDPEVASAALDALAEISRRYDLRIG